MSADPRAPLSDGGAGDSRRGANTRFRSELALLRYNARICSRDAPPSARAIRLLLDPALPHRTQAAAALRLVGYEHTGHRDSHHGCEWLQAIAQSARPSARLLGQARSNRDEPATTVRASRPSSSDARLLLDHVAGLVALSGTRFGDAAPSTLISCYTLFRCPDLARCPTRARVVSALAAPHAFLLLDSLAR